MLPYDYGRHLFDAMITKDSRRFFDAVSLIYICKISFQAKVLFQIIPIKQNTHHL